MKINLKVSQVDSNGDIHYGFSYRDINVIADKNTNPEIIAAMKKSFKGIAGIKGNLVITSSGKVKNKKFIVPKTIDPMLSQTLEQLNKSTDQLSVSFPSSTVGLGAKWRVNNSIETMGIKFNQASTYEVLKIDRQGMTIKTDIVQSSPTQDIVLPGVPKGFKAKIISLNSTGGGTYVVKFNSLLPISGQLSINTDTQMSMQFESTKPPVKIDSQLLVDLNMMTK